jgi:hypothetical protein
MRGLARFMVMLFAHAVAIGTATAAFLIFLYVAKSDLLVRIELVSAAAPPSDIFKPFVMIIVGIVAGLFTLLPALVTLVFAEMCSIQSARYFLIWGLTAWGGLWFIFGLSPWIESARAFGMLTCDTAAFVVGGLTWGAIYWIIAGSRSGDWIDARQAG